MDGNKDAAARCFQIGKAAIEGGDRARAVRFLTKARRLDPSLPVDDLLKSFEGEEEETSSCKSPKQPEETNGSGSSSSRVREKEKENSGESSRSYTEEQVSVVGRIKKEKDYYQILGLERSCSVDDVRKAYRKLSLKVHPDKNKAPGAEEAFKAVSKAFQCLSNEETRKRYDVVGSDEPVQVRRRTTRHEPFGFNGFYEGDVDAEEIFRNFFFGGMAPATTQFGQFRFRTGGMGGGARAQDVHGSGNSNFRMLIQVLPILFLILLNFIPSADPPYSLSRSYSHEHRVETKRGVSYFVKSGFEQKYPSHTAERATLERRVEREYLSIVSQNCRLELQRQQWGFTNETPHCEMLQKYESAEV